MDIAKTIRESNQTFDHSMQQMSQCIMFIAQGLGRSMDMTGNARATPNNANSQNPYFSQNTFTRNTPLAPKMFSIHRVLISSTVRMIFLLVGTII